MKIRKRRILYICAKCGTKMYKREGCKHLMCPKCYTSRYVMTKTGYENVRKNGSLKEIIQ